MGRGAEEVFVAAADDEEMAVLDAGVEADTAAVLGVGGEVLVEEVDEGGGFFGLEPAAGMILQNVAFNADEVAAQGEIVGLEFYTNGSGLEGTAAFVNEVLVVAEDAAVGDFAARMETVGDGLQQSAATVGREPVHGRCVGVLEEGLASKSGHVPVGHTVAKDDEVAEPARVTAGREGAIYIMMWFFLHCHSSFT